MGISVGMHIDICTIAACSDSTMPVQRYDLLSVYHPVPHQWCDTAPEHRKRGALTAHAGQLQ